MTVVDGDGDERQERKQVTMGTDLLIPFFCIYT